MEINRIYTGNAWELAKQLPDQSVQTIVTSPPYWGLRDYGQEGQFGLERTPEEYVDRLTALFRELRRALRDDGTVWLNLGDSYNGSGGAGGDYAAGGLKGGQPKYPGRNVSNLKPKDLVGIPWAVAFALRADGWYLRSDIIWSKPNPMPESVTDRPTKAHEYIFLLSKCRQYYYDADAVREITGNECAAEKYENVKAEGTWQSGGSIMHAGSLKTQPRLTNPLGRNRRSVWTVTPHPYKDAHFATFPPELIKPCILAGAPVGETVLDPFMGSGTTASVAVSLQRNFIGFELNPKYVDMAHRRLERTQIGFAL